MSFSFYPLELTKPAISYLCLGSFTVLYAMTLKFFKEKLFLSEALPATIFGIILGPHGANVLNPRGFGGNNDHKETNAITLEITRVTLAMGLFVIGTELPERYLARKWKSLSIMIIPTMAFGWIISAAFMFLLFPKLSFISCLCISACLTPTDPILSAAILSGEYATKNVAEDLRNLISAESAANDGLAYPFLSLSIYLVTDSLTGRAFTKWLLVGALYQVILGVIIGACIGYTFRKILSFSRQKNLLEQESYVTQYIALVLFCIGVICIIGSDDLLGTFAAGCALGWDGDFHKQVKAESFAKVVEFLLNCVAFIYIGAWLPFELYNASELHITPWRLTVLLVIILCLRRIPFLLVVYKWIPEVGGLKGALFAGHYGPMGVGAIFISSLAATRLEDSRIPPANQEERLAACLQPIVSFIVLGSIIVHGLSIPLSQLGVKIIKSTTHDGTNSSSASLHHPASSHKTEEVSLEEGTLPAVEITHTLFPDTLKDKETTGIGSATATFSDDKDSFNVFQGS